MWSQKKPAMPKKEEIEKMYPVLKLSEEVVSNPKEEKLQVTWLGHASVLTQSSGFNVLFDPIFSERCSPTQYLGPKRFTPAPCDVLQLSQLLKVDVCVISHNHYDHLDLQSVIELEKHFHPGSSPSVSRNKKKNQISKFRFSVDSASWSEGMVRRAESEASARVGLGRDAGIPKRRRGRERVEASEGRRTRREEGHLQGGGHSLSTLLWKVSLG